MAQDQSSINIDEICEPPISHAKCESSSEKQAVSATSNSQCSQDDYTKDEKEDQAKDDFPEKELKELSNSVVNGAVEAVRLERMGSTLSNRKSNFKEENGLGKGVVLNAHLLDSPKNNWVPDSEIHKSKDLELVQKFKNLQTAEKVVETNSKPMTILRKLAFGLSFIPSVLFVLFFAVILPCKDHPCVTKIWERSFNNTELVGGLGITQEVLVGLHSDEENQLLGLDNLTGSNLWSRSLRSELRFIECTDFDVNGDGLSDCLIVDQSGWIHAINTTDGHTFWNYSISVSSPLPVVLSDCDGDGVREVAYVLDSVTIQIMSKNKELTSLEMNECNITKTHVFTSWSHDNGSDLVFSCRSNEGTEKLKHLSLTSWCTEGKKDQQNISASELLDSSRDGVKLNEALFSQVPGGLAVWAQQLLVVFNSDVTEKWRTNISDHTQKRFLVYGSFSVGENIVLISSNANRSLLITLLDLLDGNNISTLLQPQAELKEVITLSRKREHRLLLLFEESIKAERRANHEAVDRNNGTEHSLRSRNTKFPSEELIQKIVLFHFEKKRPIIEIQKNELFTTTYDIVRETDKDITKMAAFLEDDHLMMLLGRTILEAPKNNIRYNTYLKKLKAPSWDMLLLQCANAN